MVSYKRHHQLAFWRCKRRGTQTPMQKYKCSQQCRPLALALCIYSMQMHKSNFTPLVSRPFVGVSPLAIDLSKLICPNVSHRIIEDIYRQLLSYCLFCYIYNFYTPLATFHFLHPATNLASCPTSARSSSPSTSTPHYASHSIVHSAADMQLIELLTFSLADNLTSKYS